jgi:hypothetical protein
VIGSSVASSIGQPVLVKISYFPNWKASGAEGPYRVTPNLMVVVPTSTHVELHYGDTGVEYLSWLLTAFGVAGLVLLFRRGDRPVGRAWWDPFGPRPEPVEPHAAPVTPEEWLTTWGWSDAEPAPPNDEAP